MLFFQGLNINKRFLPQIFRRNNKRELNNSKLYQILLKINQILQILFQLGIHFMRLNFELKKINISPVVHIQILRHADEFENKYASGELYGALYDDEAEVTNILPFPEKEKMQTKEDLQSIERRYDEHLVNFNLDQEKLGWYLVCYQRNFWDELESINFYENYINTSFFLVFDYKARQIGANPYKAYRLKDEFALKTNFQWSDLQKCSISDMNPFVQIPIQVKKNELFEGLMYFNKQRLLKEFENNRKLKSKRTNNLKKNIEQFLQAFEQQAQIQKKLKENYQKTELNERVITFKDYSQYLGQALKLQQYEAYFKRYQKNLKKYSQIMQGNN